MDLHGILGADPDVRNGFSGVTVSYQIDADAAQEEIEALVAQSQKRSAVYDILTNPTDVTVTVADVGHRRHTTVVVGAGHCGLAMSRHLAERSIDHVVLERGEVANSWRTQRWDSLRLLTPNWMTRLPGFAYRGRRPGRLPDRPRWPADRGLRRGVGGAGADRHHGDRRAARPEAGYVVETEDGELARRDRGGGDRATCTSPVPPVAAAFPPGSLRDRRGLPQPRPAADGGVLVVGASASGVQIAEELQRSGGR